MLRLRPVFLTSLSSIWVQPFFFWIRGFDFLLCFLIPRHPNPPCPLSTLSSPLLRFIQITFTKNILNFRLLDFSPETEP